MLYDRLTPMEYLEFVAGLWGVDARPRRARAEELLSGWACGDRRAARCEGFSRGMKQKTALAGALIHEPALLILDEPLTGLDAAVARQVKDLLQERVKRRRHGDPDHPHPRGRRADGRPHRHHPERRPARRGTLDELRARAGEGQGTLEDVFLVPSLLRRPRPAIGRAPPSACSPRCGWAISR